MKKVLAWAVALALVLSSFTMAFAADTKTSADFSDADQIHYTEAVDVMVATGIINGYPDGTFGPAKTVKRSEMAKMIAVMMNGGEDIGDQYKGACPFADSKDHWAAGYIAYCASEHIIDGRSADVFDPEAEVTGTEVAKMALTSLGYDSKIQGYTGENWAAAVLKDAKKNDLFDGLDSSFVPGDPCNRESAAQILFNCLKATEVQYDAKMTVNAGDASVEVSGKAIPVPSGKQEDGATANMQLYEDVFNGKLVLTPKADGTPAVTDEYGNPGHTWTYDKEKVGTYTDTPAYEFVVEKIKGANEANEANVLEAFKNYNEDAAEKAAINPVVVNNGANAKVGLGDTVKLYEDKAHSTDTVTTYKAIVEHYEAYKISDVNTNVKSADVKKDVKAYITFDGLRNGTTAYFKDTEIEGYDASTYVKDAIVAVAVGQDGKIINSFVMEELASGEVTATDSDGVVSIDGKDYEKATAYKPIDNKPIVADGSEFTLYDYNGYYLASVLGEQAESDVHFGILLASGKQAGTFSDTKVVKVFTAEGKEEVLEYSKDAGFNSLGKETFNDADGTDDILIAYTLDEDGVIDSFNKYGETAITATTLPDNAAVKTNGVLDKKFVSDEVVVFYNEAEEDTSVTPATKDSKYVIYGLADLEEAEAIAGKYMTNKDNDTIMAVCLTAPLESTESILGFVTDVKEKTTKDGAIGTITALVDGKEVTYTTVAKYTFKSAAETAKTEKALVEFVLNSDNKLKNVVALDPAGVPDLEHFAGKAVKFNGNTKVFDKMNNALDMTGQKEYQPIEGAYVYFIGEDGLEVSSYSAIRATSATIETNATLYQTVKDSENWNIVVFSETELTESGNTTPAPTPADGEL